MLRGVGALQDSPMKSVGLCGRRPQAPRGTTWHHVAPRAGTTWYHATRGGTLVLTVNLVGGHRQPWADGAARRPRWAAAILSTPTAAVVAPAPELAVHYVGHGRLPSNAWLTTMQWCDPAHRRRRRGPGQAVQETPAGSTGWRRARGRYSGRSVFSWQRCQLR